MVESRPHCSHYLTEAFQILPHILELDSLLLFQKLQSAGKQGRIVTEYVMDLYSGLSCK